MANVKINLIYNYRVSKKKQKIFYKRNTFIYQLKMFLSDLFSLKRIFSI